MLFRSDTSPLKVPVTLSLAPRPNQPPTARFTISPSSPKVGDSVRFDASGSSDPDGQIVRYSWDFGDGSTGSGSKVTHIFSRAGSYTVRLTVTDDRGATASTSHQLTVRQPQPIARFSASPTQGTAPLAVRFTNRSENYTSSSWEFGDGSRSTETNPTHTYHQTAGHYTVTLSVAGPGGRDQATTVISVSEPSPASRCGDVLYEDDFSDPDSGWFVGADSQGFDWNYTDEGEYRVLSGSPHYVAWSWAPTKRSFTDFCLEVDVRQVVAGSLSDDGAMGLIFAGNPQARTFTLFRISPGHGTYGVWSITTGWQWKTQVDWTRSNAVKGVNTWNHLLIVARGDKVSFYVNGTLLTTTSLDSAGSVGLLSETFDKPNTNAHFDNFRVSAVH